MRTTSTIQRSVSSTLSHLRQVDPNFKNRSPKEQAMLAADRLEAMLAATG